MSEAVSKVQQALRLWSEGQDKFDEASSILKGGPASFYSENINTYVSALFNKYAPFKEGDRVKIIKKTNTKKWLGLF